MLLGYCCERRIELKAAWESKRYKSIREMEIMQPSTGTSELAKGFRQHYRGDAAKGFLEYLKDNEKKWREPVNQYYGKFCSIVQSSGTGKTRLLFELANQNVIVLYMNLRESGDDTGFPARDVIPANILTGNVENEESYTTTCRAFFAAIFTCLRDELQKSNRKRFITEWNTRMTTFECQARRTEFFERLKEAYDTEYPKVKQDGANRMRFVLGTMYDLFQKFRNQPRFVIAIDEAHTLTPNQRDEWRPSIVFCRAIADFSTVNEGKYWVVFTSTTSKVADFAASRVKYNSARVVTSGQLLFPPYTELGWDHKATPYDDIPLDDNAQAKYILGFGRPLSGLIDIGKTGELANRLIWLIAKDNYVRKTQVLTVPSLVSEEFADCRRIPVIGFLEHVFGDSFWSTIGEGRGEDVKAEFNDAYINFSRWVSMKSIMGNRDIISASEFLERLWQRTCAVQWCHGQPLVDAMVPLYFPLKQAMSQFFISVKLTKKSNQESLTSILRTDTSIDLGEPDRPWIALLVDYGVATSQVTATFTPPNRTETKDRPLNYNGDCLRIYAAGLTHDTFKFLKDQDSLETLQELVTFEEPPEPPDRPIATCLRKHMEFGNTSMTDNIRWEK